MEALRNNICGRLRAVPPKRNRGRIISPPEQRERPHIAGGSLNCLRSPPNHELTKKAQAEFLLKSTSGESSWYQLERSGRERRAQQGAFRGEELRSEQRQAICSSSVSGCAPSTPPRLISGSVWLYRCLTSCKKRGPPAHRPAILIGE